MPRSPDVIKTLEIFDKISFSGAGFSPKSVLLPSSSSAATSSSAPPTTDLSINHFVSNSSINSIGGNEKPYGGINGHEKAVIDYHEKEVLKTLHNLEYDNNRKSEMIRIMRERITELDHELKDSNELGAIVIGLESQVEELQQHIRALNTQKRQLDAGIKALQRSKDEADEVNAKLRPISTCSACGRDTHVVRKSSTSQQRALKSKKTKIMEKARHQSRAKHNKGFGFIPSSSPSALTSNSNKLSTFSSSQSPTKHILPVNTQLGHVNQEHGDDDMYDDDEGELKPSEIPKKLNHKEDVTSDINMDASRHIVGQLIHDIDSKQQNKLERCERRLKDSQRMVESLKEKLSQESQISTNLTESLEKMTAEKLRLEKQVALLEKKFADKKKIVAKKGNDRLNEIEQLKSTVTETKSQLNSTKNEVRILSENNNDLKKQITTLKKRINESKSSINDISAKQKSEIEETTRKYEAMIESVRSAHEMQLKNATHLKENEVQAVEKKLELALSSDIESRESYETLIKALNTVSNELNSTLSHDLDIARNNPSPHSANSLAIITRYDRLQSMLLAKSNPMTLVSIFTYISRMLEQYVMLLKRESEEGHLVSRSLDFATNSRNIVKSLSNELKVASDAIRGVDEFVSSTLSQFERNGIIKEDELSSLQISGDVTKGPVNIDVGTRNKAFSLISTGISKLINNEIVSVFEEANTFARNVIKNSPLTSPTNSPLRGRRSRAEKNVANYDHHIPSLEGIINGDCDGEDRSYLTMSSLNDIFDAGSSSSTALEVMTFDDLLGRETTV